MTITTKSPDSAETAATGADPATPFDELVERFVRERQAAIRREAVQTRRAAQSTYDAVLWVLREYGIARIDDQWMQPRLADSSTAQLKDLIAAMERMQPRYPRTITDELLSTLKDYYDVATKR
jgi:hypothetical protein